MDYLFCLSRAITLLLFSVTSSSCLWSEKPVTQIGNYTITKKEITQRNQISQIFYPAEKNPDVGLIQLINAFTLAQILENNGHPITPEVLKKESARIDFSTKAPATLERVKQIFGKDQEAYMKLFVLPTYVERVIYFDFFHNDPRIQGASRQKATEFLQEVAKSPEQFLKTAQAKGIQVSAVMISESEGLVFEPIEKEAPQGTHGGKKTSGEKGPQLIDQSSQSQNRIQSEMKAQMERANVEEGRRWIQELITPHPVGKLIPQIIDQGNQWLVLKIYSRDSRKKSYTLHAASFPKADYSQWLNSEKAKVVIRGKTAGIR